VEFAILDIETSGGKPKESRIIEIAIIVHDGKKVIETYETLINPEKKIDWFVQKLTGIKDKDVVDSPIFADVADKILSILKDRIFVAHNISFDYPIVRNEFNRLGIDVRLPHMCTIETSKVLIPNLESYGLKNLTKYLEIDLDNHHRAMDDTLATARIFEHIYTLDDTNFEAFIKQDINPTYLHPNLNLQFYDDIPNKIGVYRFFNDKKELIFVGKATHLKKSVEQHLKNVTTKKGKEMQGQIARIEYDLIGSSLVSQLKEVETLKKSEPKYSNFKKNQGFPFGLYNVMDDSGYLNFKITKLTSDRPLFTFASEKEGLKKLKKWQAEFDLCQKLCHLQKGDTECEDLATKKCSGACIGIENSEFYNIKAIALINKLNFEKKSFLLLDKGKTKNDYSFVFVSKGKCIGYGNVLKFLIKKDPNSFKKPLIKLEDNINYGSIVNLHISKNEKLIRIDL